MRSWAHATAAGLAVLVVVTGCAHDRSSEAAGRSASATPTSTSSEPTTSAKEAPEVIDRRAVIAAAVEHRVHLEADIPGRTPIERVAVANHFTHTFDELQADPTAGPGPPIDSATQSSIEAALAPISVVWVASLPAEPATDPTATATDTAELWVVDVAEPTMTGDRAETWTTLSCGNMCGHGDTFVLKRSPTGSWHVFGTTGVGYIS